MISWNYGTPNVCTKLTSPTPVPAPDHPVVNDPNGLDELTGMIAGLREVLQAHKLRFGLGGGKRNILVVVG